MVINSTYHESRINELLRETNISFLTEEDMRQGSRLDFLGEDTPDFVLYLDNKPYCVLECTLYGVNGVERSKEHDILRREKHLFESSLTDSLQNHFCDLYMNVYDKIEKYSEIDRSYVVNILDLSPLSGFTYMWNALYGQIEQGIDLHNDNSNVYRMIEYKDYPPLFSTDANNHCSAVLYSQTLSDFSSEHHCLMINPNAEFPVLRDLFPFASLGEGYNPNIKVLSPECDKSGYMFLDHVFSFASLIE